MKVEEDDKLNLLPDPAVPLGLIAKLALESKRKTSTAASAKDGDETDDDNVVSAIFRWSCQPGAVCVVFGLWCVCGACVRTGARVSV